MVLILEEFLVSCSSEQVLISSFSTQIPCTAGGRPKDHGYNLFKDRKNLLFSTQKNFDDSQGCVLLPLKILGASDVFFLSCFVFWFALFLIGSGLYPQLRRYFKSWK